MIKKFLLQASQLPKEEFKADDVANYVVHKLKLLKIGMLMILKSDFHATQIQEMLKSIGKSASAVIEAADLKKDFDHLLMQIAPEAERDNELDESVLSDRAKKIIVNPLTHLSQLSPVYLKQLEGLAERESSEWLSYE